MKPADLEAYVQTDPELIRLRERVAALRRIGTSEPHEWAQPIQRARGVPVCDCEECAGDDDPTGMVKGFALGIALGMVSWALVGLLLWWGLVR